jgi:hypothetical protein
MANILSLIQSSPTHLNPPLFIFKRCSQAAYHNAQILEKHNFDLDKIIRAQHPSQISYGSEFKGMLELEEVLRDHPFWPRLKDLLENGASFPLQPISDETRHLDLSFHQDRGNHPSLLKHAAHIDPVIEEDVERGFTLPLPINILHQLPKPSLAPLGCHKQTTINELGEVLPKYRLTHDQSFPGRFTCAMRYFKPLIINQVNELTWLCYDLCLFCYR